MAMDLPLHHSKPIQEADRKLREIQIKLHEVLTLEQLDQVADLIARVQERAVSRRCEQTIVIIFNDRGFPRHFNGSDNVNAILPFEKK